MRAFVINLDKDGDRLRSMSGQLARCGVSFERYPAVSAKDIPREHLARAVNRFRWWCAIGRPVRAGEIGCAMSHYGIYRKMLDEGIKCALIMEDDIEINPIISEELGEIEKFLDVLKPQVCLLSNHTEYRPRSSGITIERGRMDLFAECYVITETAAKALLRANWPLCAPCDHWPRWVRRGLIDLFHVFPTVSRQMRSAYGSQTSPKGVFDVSKLNSAQLLLHKLKRVVGLAIDRMI